MKRVPSRGKDSSKKSAAEKRLNKSVLKFDEIIRADKKNKMNRKQK